MQSHSRIKRKINGVLLLDKAKGISSNHALQQVKRLFQAEKAGHTGVLDPLASGLLPICFGEATKFAQYLLDADKSYIASLRLGQQTTTADAEGEIINQSEHKVSVEEFEQACQKLTGEIIQIPPMYSALKYQGKALYEYARKGIEIERKQRQVRIYKIELIKFDFPDVVIQVHCSKGTYIRTLAEDIAQEVQTYAYLTDLRRTQTAGFYIEDVLNYETLSALELNQREAVLLPCDIMLQHFETIYLDKADIFKIQNGQYVHFVKNYETITTLRLYNRDHKFVGLVQYLPEKQEIKALRLMNTGKCNLTGLGVGEG